MAQYVVGAGGLGREVLDVALAGGETVTAFADELCREDRVRGLPVVDVGRVVTGDRAHVGIAAADVRARLVAVLAGRGVDAWTLVHPRAVVGPETELAPGCLVMAGAHVSSSVVVGRASQVQYNATVGHDVRIGAVVTVLPGANVSGSVRLGDRSTVGSGAVVLPGLRVGAGAYVGAGAVVTRDVPEGATVVGVPARPLAR